MTAFQILAFIMTTQLTSLKINCSLEQHPFLPNFLAGQRKLEELAFRNVTMCGDSIPVDLVKNMKFPLKRLSMNSQLNLLQTKSNSPAFLHNFIGSLEMLEISGYFANEVYEMIFKNFLKLKSLKIDVNYAPTENAFYHNLRPNLSVKKLHVIFRQSSLKALEGIIGNLPNVETLVLDTDEIPQSLMLFIANNLRKLNNLFITICKFKSLSGVRIESLKSLRVFSLESQSAAGWKSLVKAFPNVEAFTVVVTNDKNSLSDRMFNIFTKGWKNLSHLKLGLGFVAVKRIFNQLLRNCQELKIVEVLEESFQKARKNSVLRDFKRDGLRLIIHPNEELGKMELGESCGLWAGEEVAEEFEDSDNESGLNFSDFDIVDIIGIIHQIELSYDSDDYENEYIYYDGEIRNWLEEPDSSDLESLDD